MNNKSSIFNNPILKLVSKIISWFVLSFLIIIAGVLMYYVVSAKLAEINGQTYQPAFSLYTIISPSMEPNINVYDVVVTKRVDTNTINEGDVITYVSTSSLGEGLTITHRVISKIITDDDVKFRTKGDNNNVADSALVSSENVLGKVIFKIPYLGHLQFLLQSKSGWIFLLLIPAMIVVLYDVIKVIRLSNVKQKVEESIKEQPENIDLKNKQLKLKENLKEKYESTNVEEKSIPTIKEEKTNKKDAIEKSNKIKDEINNNMPSDDLNRILNNINKLNDENIDVPKMISNIENIEEDSIDLPKLK